LGVKSGVSTVAGRAGGPARSSGEAPVIGVERRGRVVCGCVCPVNRGPVRPGEELHERCEIVSESVLHFEVGGLAGIPEGQGEQGCTRGGWCAPGGVRDGSREQSVQDLESDVFGELLSPSGACGGDTETAWRRHEGARGAYDRGQDRPNCGSWEAARKGRADLSSRLLWLSPGAVAVGCGRDMPGALLEI